MNQVQRQKTRSDQDEAEVQDLPEDQRKAGLDKDVACCLDDIDEALIIPPGQEKEENADSNRDAPPG
jgi:hypothetical protein